LRDALLHAGNPEVVKLLIEHGAALDARDRHGRTPYMRAARFKNPATMELLAEAGASTELDPAAEFIGAIVRGEHEHAAQVRAEHPGLVLPDDDKEALPRWASAGDDAVIERLLDAGVPLDARGIDDGTALHYAGLWGRASTVALLLARGADVDLLGGPRERPGTALAWTAWGSRALPGASQRLDGYLEAARLLVGARARVTPGMIEVAADEVAVVLEEASPLSAARASWGEQGEIVASPTRRVVPSGSMSASAAGATRSTTSGRPSPAPAPSAAGWSADRIVAEQGLNVNRTGRVFVPAVEGRDLDALVQTVAETSLAVRAALLDFDR
jgi:hypothetical protein